MTDEVKPEEIKRNGAKERRVLRGSAVLTYQARKPRAPRGNRDENFGAPAVLRGARAGRVRGAKVAGMCILTPSHHLKVSASYAQKKLFKPLYCSPLVWNSSQCQSKTMHKKFDINVFDTTPDAT